jgi:hypothetical protein
LFSEELLDRLRKKSKAQNSPEAQKKTVYKGMAYGGFMKKYFVSLILCSIAIGLPAFGADLDLSGHVKVDLHTPASLAAKTVEGGLWAAATKLCKEKKATQAILVDEKVSLSTVVNAYDGSENIVGSAKFDCK